MSKFTEWYATQVQAIEPPFHDGAVAGWNEAIRVCAELLEDGNVPYDGDEPSPFDFARALRKWYSEPPR